MTLKGGNSQACAACKYQRRKCSSECPLAPYFPPDQPKMFQNAHKLFGVSNILKILKQLDPTMRVQAVRSIIDEANIRDQFPVHGCRGVIRQLHYQLRQAEEELHAVLQQLEIYRQHNQLQVSPMPVNSPSYLQLGMGSNSDPTVMDPLWNQHSLYCEGSTSNSANPLAIQSQVVNPLPLSIQQEVGQDYEEVHPLFDTIDDRQSYINSKDAYDHESRYVYDNESVRYVYIYLFAIYNSTLSGFEGLHTNSCH